MQEEEYWTHTVQQNSVFSYNQYVQNYPDDNFYEEAKNAIIQIEEKEKERIERNRQELEKAKTELEKQKIEADILWESARDTITLDSCHNYLEKSKLFSYREKANMIIAEIEKNKRDALAEQEKVLIAEQENTLWEEVITENNIQAYEKYLQSTTLGLFKENAQEIMIQLRTAQKEKEVEQQFWKKTVTENSRSAFNQYL